MINNQNEYKAYYKEKKEIVRTVITEVNLILSNTSVFDKIFNWKDVRNKIDNVKYKLNEE